MTISDTSVAYLKNQSSMTVAFNYVHALLLQEGNGVRLKTTVNQSGNITRKIIYSWNNSVVRFNDSGVLKTTYSISRLKASTAYRLFDNSVQFATSTANSNGVLPSFSINLDSEHEITVQEQLEVNNITVTLNLPLNAHLTNNATIVFNCSTSASNNLTNITLYGNWSGWHANETKAITGTYNSTTFTKALSNGTYKWNCLAYDVSGNSRFAPSNYTFRIDTSASATTTTTSTSTTTTTTAYSTTTSTTTTLPGTTTSTMSPTATTTTPIEPTSTTTSTTTSTNTTPPLCSVKGDLPPCDGLVDDWELLDYINKWAKGLVLDFDLLEAIKIWAGG